ncbi:hypothetical protein E4K10_46990 [Streptomyces sp. T1317-0309]|nr:hypothetical protein E4K10_46990 [Streptomyces sp. T1317-0309]
MIEVNRPDRSTRRHQGNTVVVDAEAAAPAVISGGATVASKTGDGAVEMHRAFTITKGSAITDRTQAINQLKGILVNEAMSCVEGLDFSTSRQSRLRRATRSINLRPPAVVRECYGGRTVDFQ